MALVRTTDESAANNRVYAANELLADTLFGTNRVKSAVNQPGRVIFCQVFCVCRKTVVIPYKKTNYSKKNFDDSYNLWLDWL